MAFYYYSLFLNAFKSTTFVSSFPASSFSFCFSLSFSLFLLVVHLLLPIYLFPSHFISEYALIGNSCHFQLSSENSPMDPPLTSRIVLFCLRFQRMWVGKFSSQHLEFYQHNYKEFTLGMIRWQIETLLWLSCGRNSASRSLSPYTIRAKTSA